MLFNPRDKQTWLGAMNGKKLKSSDTMYSISKFQPGSRVADEQYLLLRVLWSPAEKPIGFALFQKRKIPQLIIEKAENRMKGDTSWQEYLSKLPGAGESRSPVPLDIGLFSTTRWQQLAIATVKPNQDILISPIVPNGKYLSRLQREAKDLQESAGFTDILPKRVRPLQQKIYLNSTSARELSGLSGSSGGQSELSEGSNCVPSEGSEVTGAGIRAPPETVEGPADADDDAEFQDEKISAAADDEQIVNQALITLLDALTITAKLEIECSSKRQRFKYSDLWVAATDGVLRSITGAHAVEAEFSGIQPRAAEIHAIIEVKAAARGYRMSTIQRQEAAEMVTWIYSDPKEKKTVEAEHGPRTEENNSKKAGKQPEKGGKQPEKHWRLLIAQDYDQLWFIVAEYSAQYLEYIRWGKQQPDEEDFDKLEDDSFMLMTQYGPYNIGNRNEMSQFGTAFVAFCLYAKEKTSTDNPDQDATQNEGKKDPENTGAMFLECRDTDPYSPSKKDASRRLPLR